jgi:hypothetical protein
MAVPYDTCFPADFDQVFPQGAYIIGEVVPVTECQSREDKARNRPIRPRVDEATGLPLFPVTSADPSVEKDRDKSITVETAAKQQPVPLAAVANLPFRLVIPEGPTVQPRAETSGQAKWITWVIRATGLRAVDAPKPSSSAKSAAA